jgi:hypothetical protein
MKEMFLIVISPSASTFAFLQGCTVKLPDKHNATRRRAEKPWKRETAWLPLQKETHRSAHSPT